MQVKIFQIIIILLFLTSCYSKTPSIKMIGKFHADKDLFLAQFDSKTDVDDIHSIAGVATILRDPRFAGVKYHAVAGAYGIQEGLYVPANELFEEAFGNNWSDADSNFELALKEVTSIVIKTLKEDGDIWIAEAGQSDFASALIRNLKNINPSVQTEERIHVVQHSDWNENNASQQNLNFVKSNSDYIKIPDGNEIGNGSPGFKTYEHVIIKDKITDEDLLRIWEIATEIANKYNGIDNRYKNPAIADGGLDFSDVAETCCIFGFDHILDADQFFKTFSSSSEQ